MKKVIQLKFSRPLPSHSPLSPIAAEGRKAQGGAEKIIHLLIHDYLKLKIMTKKMKLVATLATSLIAAAGVMTFEACNKKDKDSVEPLVQNHRMPLATFDHNHGTMTYSFDLDKINADFNRSLSRTAENRYIVESIEILDDAPTDAEVCPEIKIVVIDTEEEASTTMWFMDTFAEKDVDGSNTVYFLDSEVESGNYVFATKNDDGTLNVYSVVDGTVDSVSNELPCNAWRPKWTISCKATNCTHDCEKVKIGPHNWSCTECKNGGTCVRGTSILVDIIVAVIPVIIGAIIA